MGLEACPKCGHLTHVYADAGNREHEPGCPLARRGRCDSTEGGIRCRGLKGHKPPHWGARNPGDSLIGNKMLYGLRLTPMMRAIFWTERHTDTPVSDEGAT